MGNGLASSLHETGTDTASGGASLSFVGLASTTYSDQGTGTATGTYVVGDSVSLTANRAEKPEKPGT